ncbi:MAG: class I SAM-dependent methyltransferase [Acidiferrobacterales bacterium]|nr:class I SAM-dependent methyltransferase [Acidiferrobacterales bacterium]
MPFELHRNRLTYDLDLAKLAGIEIGPLVNPIVKREVSNVKYVDRASTDELKKWYSRDPNINVDEIMHIDYIWGDQSLEEATSGADQFDYCVASHVIEHIPDLITWLGEIASILKVGGVACFAVPDKRYTFDYLRSVTTIADIVDSHFQKLRKPSFRHIYDHFSNHTELDIEEAWSDGFDGRYLKPSSPPSKAYSACIDALENDKYVDSHCSVFTEQSFFDLLHSISELGLLDFKIRKHFPVETYMFEFFVQLEKIDSSLEASEKHAQFIDSLDQLNGAFLEVDFNCSQACIPKIYYDSGNGFNEDETSIANYTTPNSTQTLKFNLPIIKDLRLRFDPAEFSGEFKVDNMNLQLGSNQQSIDPALLNPLHGISKIQTTNTGATIKTKKFTKDPALEIKYQAAS